MLYRKVYELSIPPEPTDTDMLQAILDARDRAYAANDFGPFLLHFPKTWASRLAAEVSRAVVNRMCRIDGVMCLEFDDLRAVPALIATHAIEAQYAAAALTLDEAAESMRAAGVDPQPWLDRLSAGEA